MELQVVLNTFASDVFRKQGDCDYVAARSNFRLQLRQQFLWSSQQAIEKYLKAILLYNGKSARYPQGSKNEFRHNLNALVDEIKKIDFLLFDLTPAQDAFVRYLAQQGPNRYIGTTSYNTDNVLRDLDSTVWHIRRYCQFMTDRGPGAREAVPGMREAIVAAALHESHKQHPHKYTLVGGELEKILKMPKTDPARRALVWANLYYGAKKRCRVTYRTFVSFEIPPNERSWFDLDRDDIQKFIKL